VRKGIFPRGKQLLIVEEDRNCGYVESRKKGKLEKRPNMSSRREWIRLRRKRVGGESTKPENESGDNPEGGDAQKKKKEPVMDRSRKSWKQRREDARGVHPVRAEHGGGH